jgi:TatA/E family protein of Tat protein translocase
MFGSQQFESIEAFMGIGQTELLIVLVVVLIIFGPTKLPQLARSIGRSVRELKSGMSDLTSDDEPASRKNSTADADAKKAETSDAQPVERADSQTTKNA